MPRSAFTENMKSLKNVIVMMMMMMTMTTMMRIMMMKILGTIIMFMIGMIIKQ